MTPAPRPPYCLSRQHPELANRSPAPRGPIKNYREILLPTLGNPMEKAREMPTSKGL